MVSRANADLPKLPLGETKLLRWRAKDGMEIEGLLTYPVEYKAGNKVPLVLIVHGGPAGVFSDNFIGRPGIYPIASFAANGYAVLRPIHEDQADMAMHSARQTSMTGGPRITKTS